MKYRKLIYSTIQIKLVVDTTEKIISLIGFEAVQYGSAFKH